MPFYGAEVCNPMHSDLIWDGDIEFRYSHAAMKQMGYKY